jgi:TolB-like protein/Tfp pilus assembly protein PilF
LLSAVLPFTNDSPDQENEYFCNGMMEEILNQLQKIRELRVKSRTSAEQYRNEVKDIQTIGEELSVAFVLEGSVRKAGDDIRITTQLIDVRTGDHLWSETYDGNYTQKIFDFQSNVAKKVASSLNVIINPEEGKRLDKKSTVEIMAYDLYWRGMDMVDNFTATREEKYLESANVLFEKALLIDPDYASAVYGKGHALKIKEDVTSRNYDSAMVFADRVILLDPTNMEGYGLKASIYQAKGQSDLAIEYYLKSVELNPDWNWNNLLLGLAYFGKKDYQNGLYYINESLNGGEGRAWPAYYWYIGRFFRNIGDYQRSMKYFRQSLILQPHRGSITGYFQSLLSLHKVHESVNYLDSACIVLVDEPVCSILKFYGYLDLKDYDQAEKHFNQFLNDTGRPNLQDSIWFSYLLKETGREKEANLILQNCKIAIEKQLSKDRGRSGRLFLLSAINAIQNDKSASLKYLEDAFVMSAGRRYDDQIEIDPIFESLWEDPEFKTIVKQAQDKKAAIRAQMQEMIESGEIDL